MSESPPTSPDSESAELLEYDWHPDRPASDHVLLVPALVSLEGDRLTFTFTMGEVASRPVTSATHFLDDFVRLAGRGPGDILAFASEWGPLGICSHGRPSTHLRTEALGCLPMVLPDRPNTLWEPLSAWTTYSRQARAILSTAAKLHHGQPGGPQDWEDIPGWDLRSAAYAMVRSRSNAPNSGRWATPAMEATVSGFWHDLETQRHVLAGVVHEHWITEGQVSPSLDWRGARARIELGGWGLFGALAVRMLFGLTRSDRLTICAACGTPFVPARRVTDDQRCYCPDSPACQRARIRDAARNHRKRSSPPSSHTNECVPK
jgi:hypothetical protein